MSLSQEMRKQEVIWAEMAAKAREKQTITHIWEACFQKEQKTVTIKAIKHLQDEYNDSYTQKQIIAAIELFEQKGKASIFLQLKGELWDNWLKKQIQNSD